MYTYLIGWSIHKKYYYGARYKSTAKPNDLLKTYFTSSKIVHHFIKENGNPDIIQIRKIFSSKKETIDWEHKVLRRLKVRFKKEWLNQTDNKGISLTKEGLENIKNKNKGLKRSKQVKLRMSLSAKLRMSKKDQTGVNNPTFKGYYITPWGRFVTIKECIINKPKDIIISKDVVRIACLNSNKKIRNGNNLKYFLKTDIGKSYKELGFTFEKKD